jgi:hypothetical protein
LSHQRRRLGHCAHMLVMSLKQVNAAAGVVNRQ